MKKIILSAAVIISGVFSSQAAGVGWVMGKYAGDMEIWGHCNIICDPNASLYCYSIKAGALQPNENLLNSANAVKDEPGPNWVSFQNLGYKTGDYITIQIYDKDQNIIKNITGYFDDMKISDNEDGSSSHDIYYKED